jgi:hypothetical protein
MKTKTKPHRECRRQAIKTKIADARAKGKNKPASQT